MGKFYRSTALAAALVLLVVPAAGKDEEHRHEEHQNHAGFLIGAVYNLHEKSWGAGLGFEYERILPFWDRLFGVGFAVETIFDEHKHYVLSALFPIHPYRELSFAIAPGILFLDDGDGFESRFSIHFAVEYEFELDKIFLAPELEVAFAGDDVHIMAGLHVGFGF